MTYVNFPLRGTTDTLQLHGAGHHKKQLELPAPTELNYDRPPGRVPRMMALMISYYAGLAQHGMAQWWSNARTSAYLPPMDLNAPQFRTNRGLRAVGGVLGAGTVSNAMSHLPSVRVPRTIT